MRSARGLRLSHQAPHGVPCGLLQILSLGVRRASRYKSGRALLIQVFSPRTRTRLELAPKVVKQACACLLHEDGISMPVSHSRLSNEPAAHKSLKCSNKYANVIRNAFYEPKKFCAFYDAFPRTKSPVPGVSAEDLLQGCKCFEHKPASIASTLHHHSRASTSAAAAESTADVTGDVTTGSPTEMTSMATTEPAMLTTSASSSTPTSTTTEGWNITACGDVNQIMAGNYYDAKANATYSVGYSLMHSSYGATASGGTTLSTTALPDHVTASDAATLCMSWAVSEQDPNQGYIIDLEVYFQNNSDTGGEEQWYCAALDGTKNYVQFPAGSNDTLQCAFAWNRQAWQEV
ncbi:hypothetical protein ANO11243_093670 [Dothideomycetidae sp. 11243]|nr:hypothetical protein ANO11243_093670 [fungal sp. No.11243]